MALPTPSERVAGIRERAVTLAPLALPLALSTPLWLAFGAAASVGVAWWLMTRWSRPATAPPKPTEAPVKEERTASPVRTEGVAPVVGPVPIEPVPEVVAPSAAAEIAIVEEIVPAAPAVVIAPAPDDLTRLVGLGPRSAAALAARGVTRFAELAAWTAEEMAAFDAETNLKGRSRRDAWVAQAKALVGGEA